MIEILLDQREGYLPGETVSGRVRWSFDQSAEEAYVNLLWHTAGKGTEDIYIVDQMPIGTSTRSGDFPFKFELPAEPYSFSGKLISLCWLVEFVCEELEENAKVEIIVSPTRKEILLGEQSQ